MRVHRNLVERVMADVDCRHSLTWNTITERDVMPGYLLVGALAGFYRRWLLKFSTGYVEIMSHLQFHDHGVTG